jgi:hypothetical protein
MENKTLNEIRKIGKIESLRANSGKNFLVMWYTSIKLDGGLQNGG